MSEMDVRSHSVRHCRDNLWMRSDAGPLGTSEYLSAYISGYADGEGCFTVSISPRAKLLVGWEVRPKGVTDGHPVNIPDLPCGRYHDGETQKDKQAVLWL